MSSLSAFLAGVAFAAYLAWATWPRAAWTADREVVERGIVQAQLVCFWRLPRRLAQWLADHWPRALLPLDYSRVLDEAVEAAGGPSNSWGFLLGVALGRVLRGGR